MAGEERSIDLIKDRPFLHVCKKDRALDDVIERRSIALQDRFHVFHSLFGLGPNPAGNQLQLARRIAYLACKIEHIADPDGFRERQAKGLARRRVQIFNGEFVGGKRYGIMSDYYGYKAKSEDAGELFTHRWCVSLKG